MEEPKIQKETSHEFKKFHERSRTRTSRGVLGAHSAYKKSSQGDTAENKEKTGFDAEIVMKILSETA